MARGTTVVDRIRAFNEGRDPDLLKRKYQLMRSSAHAFLRGTAHLFYDELPRAALLETAPAAWISGDLHLENFGTYRGNDRQVYFDLNDFDEGALAPCTWDLLRLSVSLLLATRELEARPGASRDLVHSLLEAYAITLGGGKAGWVQGETAEGMVRALIDQVRRRRRRPFLDSRTVVTDGKRRLRLDGKKAIPVSAAAHHDVMHFMRRLARERGDRILEPLDVAARIAGTGSLGLERYVVLVRGHGSPDHNLLIDLKHEPRSALRPHLRLSQPRWRSEAERVARVQERAQAVSPAFLADVRLREKSFLMKEAQPSADKVQLAASKRGLADLPGLVRTLGGLVASSQLRSSGRQGSAIADRFIAFGERASWQGELVRLAEEMADGVEEDWRAFRASSL